MTKSDERIAQVEAEVADLKNRESTRASEAEAKQTSRSDAVQTVLGIYAIIALLFSVYFEYMIAVESGFIGSIRVYRGFA